MSEVSTVVGLSDRPITQLGRVSFLSKKYTRPELFYGNFLSSRLKAKVNSLGIGEVCIDAMQFGTLTTDVANNEAVAAEFVDLTDMLGKTRERSRTQVRFGQLVLSSPSQGPKTALVAVKYTSPTLAAREFGAMTAFNTSSLSENGDVTFTPRGFVRDPNGKVGLITNYKMDALTSDTILWNEGRSERQVAAALSHAAFSAAELHIHGKAHGDLQAKNVAASLKGNWYTDLESATELVTNRGVYEPSARRLIADDIHTFLTYRGMSSPDDMVAEQFARPYVDFTAASGLPSDLAPTYDTIMSMAREPQQQSY